MKDLHRYLAPLLALMLQACASGEGPDAPADWQSAPPVLNIPPSGPDGWNLPGGYEQFGPTASTSPFCGNHLPAPARPLGLLVPTRIQETGNWCILASVQMVVGFYGLTVEQCSLADWRDEYPEGTCCGAKFDPRCDHGTGTGDTVKLLSGLGIYGAVAPGPISEDELRDEIGNGRPVIFIEAASTNSHAIVALGYDPPEADGMPAKFDIFDPITGSALVSYDDMRANYWSGWAVWPETFYRLAPSPDGCNLDFDPSCGCAGDGQ